MRFITPFSLLAAAVGSPNPVVEDKNSSEVTDVAEYEPTYPTNTQLRRPRYTSHTGVGVLMGTGAQKNGTDLGSSAAGAVVSVNLLNEILPGESHRSQDLSGFLKSIAAAGYTIWAVLGTRIAQVQGPPVLAPRLFGPGGRGSR